MTELVVGVNEPITVVGVLPPILYCTLTFGVPPVALIWEIIDKLVNQKLVVELLVILYVNHLLPVILVARVPLKVLPAIHPAGAVQLTPVPADIDEKVKPVTVGASVEVACVGQPAEPVMV